ncbi:MAG TPA: hypothetical protein VGW10_00350, partial [Solirubrobacteraceae bacterium]|nr:hypothetical protein [Solirubrobacteraceae bacterium]
DPSRRRVLIAGATHVAAVTIPSLRSRSHRIGDRSAGRTAELVGGRGLAVAGRRGLRVLDLRTWRTRWRDRAATGVLASGAVVVAIGGGVRGRDARDGTLRWRARGSGDARFSAVAAGRVYLAGPRALRILDVTTGRDVAALPPTLTAIRLLDDVTGA